MRILVAIPMAFVAALLLNVLVWLVSGASERSATPACMIAATGFGLCAFFWLRNTRSTRQTLRLALLTIAVESFGLALAGFLFLRGQAESELAAATRSAPVVGAQVVGLFGSVGLALGIVCLVLYVAVRTKAAGR